MTLYFCHKFTSWKFKIIFQRGFLKAILDSQNLKRAITQNKFQSFHKSSQMAQQNIRVINTAMWNFFWVWVHQWSLFWKVIRLYYLYWETESVFSLIREGNRRHTVRFLSNKKIIIVVVLLVMSSMWLSSDGSCIRANRAYS